MKTRTFVVAAAASAVIACILATPALAGGSASQSSGDNTYEGRQSGRAEADGDSSGSTVINAAPSASSGAKQSDSSVDAKIAQAIGAPGFRALVTVRPSESVQELQTTLDEPRIHRYTRYQQWRRGLRTVGAPDVVTSAAVVSRPRLEHGSAAEIRRVRAPEIVGSDGPLAAAETNTRVGRQTDGLTGPPGPVGPAAPDASGPVRVAPFVPSVTPAAAAVAPNPSARPAPARPRLPLNGAESARMARFAVVLMVVGFGLMGFARRFKAGVRVVKPV